MDKLSKKNQGFTLVELMVTVVIASVIVAAIYGVYLAQQRSYLAQDQVAEMQQNLRAATDIMARELRIAGYDPNGAAETGITLANSAQIGFTQDLDGDGTFTGPNENLLFGFAVADDAVGDGIADGGAAPLGRANVVPPALPDFLPIAENIHAIEFLYTMENGTTTVNPLVLTNIRSVRISMLARAGRRDENFTNTFVYCPASNPYDPATGLCANPAPATIWGPFNDNFRRRLLITTVHFRNIGL